MGDNTTRRETRIISMRVETTLLEKLDAYAHANGWSKEGRRGGDHGGRDSGRSALASYLFRALVEHRLTVTPASTFDQPPEENTMTVSVYLIQNSRRLPETTHEYKRYVLTPPTGEYQIELVNRSAQRQLVVLTVDGVNAVDGKDGTYNGAGYVLRPYETATIRGWMRSHSEMAAFEFKPQDKSYANLTGRGTSNVGVVGCAVFNEARRERVPYTTDQYTYRSPFDGGHSPRWSGDDLIGSRGPTQASIGQEVKTSGSLGADRSVGTGYGSRIEQHTGSTSFQRASQHPVEELVLRYGTREQFAAWGVGLPIETPPEPRAFPAEPSSGDGFVKPPPGWGR